MLFLWMIRSPLSLEDEIRLQDQKSMDSLSEAKSDSWISPFSAHCRHAIRIKLRHCSHFAIHLHSRHLQHPDRRKVAPIDARSPTRHLYQGLEDVIFHFVVSSPGEIRRRLHTTLPCRLYPNKPHVVYNNVP
jgi:hypothetical protein